MSIITFGTDTETGLDLPRVWTPSGVASYLDQVATELQALARDVRDARQARGTAVITNTELDNVTEFYGEVRRWLDSKPSTWWGATASRAEDYQRRISDWRRYLASKGAAGASPEVSTPTVPRLTLAPDMDTSTKVVLGIAAAAGLMLATTMLVGKFKGAAAPERAR